jgi:hypothetical protein
MKLFNGSVSQLPRSCVLWLLDRPPRRDRRIAYQQPLHWDGRTHLATEAEHVGNIRLEMVRLGVKSPKLDAADILPPPGGTRSISVNSRRFVETER